MKELDFDELDKAVNSLMKTAPKPPAEATTSNSPGPTPPTLTHVTESVSIPTRRRFMDVVRPSVDMKLPSGTSAHSRPAVPPPPTTSPVVSREGATIAPKSFSPVQVPASAPTMVTKQDSTPPSEPQVRDWPDPLEVSSPVENEALIAPPALKPPARGDDQELLASPFLPNATVEKRPLGGPVAPTTSETTAVTSTQSVFDANEEQDAQIVPSPPLHPLSEEMGSELMAIESGSQIDSEVETAEESSKIYNAPATTTQQLQQPPPTDQSTSGAIYDTANYHQPLAHPAAKASSWRIVAAIVGILLIGGSAGAGLYFLNLF